MRWPRLRGREFRWIAVGIASVLVLSIVATWLLLSTGLGTRIALAYVRGRFAPALTIGGVNGNLRGPLDVIDLRLTSGATEVAIDTVRIEWRLARLLRRELDVRQLYVSGIEIEVGDSSNSIPASEARAAPEQPLLPDVRLPVSLRLSRAVLARLAAGREGEAPAFTIDSVVAAVAVEKDSVDVAQLQVFGPDTRAGASGYLRMSGVYPLALDYDWEAVARGIRTAGHGRLHGDMNWLELRQELTEPVRVELVAQLDTVLTSRSFTATIGAVEFDVRAIDSSLTPARVAGDVQATGTFSALSAQANVELAHEAIGRATSRILLRRRAETWYVDSLDLGFRDNLGRVTGGGTVVLVDGNPTVDATLTWLRLGVPLVGRHLFTTRGRVRAVGSADTYEIDANANVRGDATPAGSLRVLAVGNRDSIVIKGSGETLSGEVTLEGVVALAPALAWNIGLHAKDLNLSGVLPDSADSVRNVEITARAHGARSDSGLFGTVRVTRLAGELREIPFSVAGVARLLPDRVSFDSVNAELLGGELAAGGMLRFDPTVEWYLAATADDIDPAALMPNSAEWTGKLSGVAQFSGSRASETVSAEVTIDTISGVLRGERIGVKAGLRVDGDAYAIDSLSLRWGSLHLAAAGELSDEMHGRLELEAPNLSLAVPGASGSLQAEIDIDGTRTEPIISARVGGADFQYREYSAEQLFGGGVLNFTTGGRFDFSIDGTGLALSGRAIDTLGVSISGVRGDHEIAVSLRSGESSFVLGAVGGIADLDWAGDLVTLNLLDSATGDWMLERPTALQASQDHVASADSICVQSDDARACVVGTWQRGGQWSLATTAESIPFARFDPLLPPRINVSGDLDAQADFHTDELGALRGTAQITSTSGDIDLRLQSGEQALAYERGSVEVTADSSGVNTTLTVSLKQSGTGDSTYADVTGRLTLPGYRPLLDSVAQQPIEGQLQMSLSDLSWAEAVFPQLVATSGSLNLDFTLAGTTESPRVFGTARLNAGADVPRLGLQLRNAELRAVGEGAAGIRLEGSVESGSGRMEVVGRLYAGSASDSVFGLRISGTRFQAANTPEAQVWISPVLDIVKLGQQVSVSGEVQVPRAQIELREIPAVAVPVSRDVVIVGDTSQSDMPQIDIRSRVRMALGDSVSFRGFGLTARPGGSILILDEPGQTTTATGQLSIQQGRYTAYGQDLTIETGRVIYAAGPIDNPGLDIRAVRQARDGVVAGLNVAGTLKEPEVTVFSEPPMMQSEALAYLLLGRPLSELSTSEGGQLSNAAASLGLRGGSMLAQRIAQTFGIDEAGIESEGEWDEASFYAGKYLSPRLYVSYGIGLFDSSSLFRIRYNLSRRWTLQAETGEKTSTDITYKIERGR